MKMHLHPHPRRTLRRLRRLLCAALMVLSLTSVMSPLAAAADLDDGLSSGGTTANLQEVGANYVMMDEGSYQIYTFNLNTVANSQYAEGVGAAIVTDTPSGELNEIWALGHRNGYYFTLSPLHVSGCFLTSQGYDKGLTLTRFVSDDSLWRAIQNSDGSITLQCKNGYVMDTTCGRIDQVGTRILSYASNGYVEAQHYWFSRISESKTLTPPTRVNAFTKTCAMIVDANKCGNIQFARKNGGLLVVDTFNYELNEGFNFIDRGNNLVSIHPLHATDYALSCGNPMPGQQVSLKKYTGSGEDLWEVYQFSNGTYAFRNYKTKLFLDDYCCNTADGTKIICHSYNGCSAQQFTLKDFASSTSTQTQIQARLNQMIDGSYGNGVYKAGTIYKGPYSSEQCKGFAKQVHMLLFGYNIGSTKSKPYNYEINFNSGNTALVGSLTNLSGKSNSTVCNLFSAARPGDFIQVRRSHGGSHSMIFLSSNSNGVTVYECNVDGKNGIRTATISWSQFRSSNTAVSIYTARDYRLH